uniref:Uncharacterized protein n=1 Tax=Trichobilharzia regenti TaxID=157069 RepID=A0AA85J7E0_TRIRE|nr:unnamed protein product [Trichobilharzia regenti]
MVVPTVSKHTLHDFNITHTMIPSNANNSKEETMTEYTESPHMSRFHRSKETEHTEALHTRPLIARLSSRRHRMWPKLAYAILAFSLR